MKKTSSSTHNFTNSEFPNYTKKFHNFFQPIRILHAFDNNNNQKINKQKSNAHSDSLKYL